MEHHYLDHNTFSLFAWFLQWILVDIYPCIFPIYRDSLDSMTRGPKDDLNHTGKCKFTKLWSLTPDPIPKEEAKGSKIHKPQAKSWVGNHRFELWLLAGNHTRGLRLWVFASPKTQSIHLYAVIHCCSSPLSSSSLCILLQYSSISSPHPNIYIHILILMLVVQHVRAIGRGIYTRSFFLVVWVRTNWPIHKEISTDKYQDPARWVSTWVVVTGNNTVI